MKNRADFEEIKGMITVGVVSDINEGEKTARVKLEQENMISDDLKIVQQPPNTFMPSIGDWVLCVMKNGGEGEGFIIGVI